MLWGPGPYAGPVVPTSWGTGARVGWPRFDVVDRTVVGITGPGHTDVRVRNPWTGWYRLVGPQFCRRTIYCRLIGGRVSPLVTVSMHKGMDGAMYSPGTSTVRPRFGLNG